MVITGIIRRARSKSPVRTRYQISVSQGSRFFVLLEALCRHVRHKRGTAVMATSLYIQSSPRYHSGASSFQASIHRPCSGFSLDHNQIQKPRPRDILICTLGLSLAFEADIQAEWLYLTYHYDYHCRQYHHRSIIVIY